MTASHARSRRAIAISESSERLPRESRTRGAIIRMLFAPTIETKRGTASAPPSITTYRRFHRSARYGRGKNRNAITSASSHEPRRAIFLLPLPDTFISLLSYIRARARYFASQRGGCWKSGTPRAKASLAFPRHCKTRGSRYEISSAGRRRGGEGGGTR
jgi:hypothetical protein